MNHILIVGLVTGAALAIEKYFLTPKKEASIKSNTHAKKVKQEDEVKPIEDKAIIDTVKPDGDSVLDNHVNLE